MAWCDCEAGTVGNCLEAPASHPGCRKHRLSPWHQGSRSESAETWRYGDWPRNWRPEVSWCHLGPWTSPDLRGFSVRQNSFVFRVKVNAAQEPSPSSGRSAGSITATLPVLDPKAPAPPSRQTSNSLNVKCGQESLLCLAFKVICVISFAKCKLIGVRKAFIVGFNHENENAESMGTVL